ncbi:MAG: hypothetical protein ACK2T5_00755 [Anaerolineales bacterium]
MDAIFDWCVGVLVYFAGVFGITYKEINVWVFVIIWPILTLILTALVIMQQVRIRRLQKTLEDSQGDTN